MILSASRRTDIPAFYSRWFYKRIEEGYLLVRNPMNAKQISRVVLNPDIVDCIVFWTKNPEPFMKNIDKINRYKYYFQFTLNPYDDSIEKNVPDKEHLIDIFVKLSGLIGKDKVIWRYDPILLTNKIDKEYHYKWFNYLIERLHKYTDKCIISFLDLYSKTERNTKSLGIIPMGTNDMREIAFNFSLTAQKYNIPVETCAERIDLSDMGIKRGKCIDDKMISKIIGCDIAVEKDKAQREECGCVKSIDIGAYNTCRHNCVYCYANFNEATVKRNFSLHDPDSPLLYGKLSFDDIIKDRFMESYVNIS